MQNKIYIVFSPGRTGSHIILEALTGGYNQVGGLCNARPYWHPFSQGTFTLDNNIVIHTHKLSVIDELKLNPNDIILILSTRKDIFAQAMSQFVAMASGEWNGKDYSDKPAEPVTVSKEDFIKLVNTYKSWPGRILSKYIEFKKIVSIDYDDVVATGGIKHIAQILEIDYNDQLVGPIERKSPHSYKDWILNWQELYEEYCKIN